MQKSDEKLAELLSAGHQLMDVRTPGEYSSNTAKSAINAPLAELHQHTEKLDRWVRYVDDLNGIINSSPLLSLSVMFL